MKISAGKILLAEPFMQDPHFGRAAVLVTEHWDGGTAGFILNKTLEVGVADLIDGFPEFEASAFFGGPVSTDTLHFLHCVGGLLEDSMPIMPGIWAGGDFEKLKFLISQQLVTPEQVRFFVGYSGWESGQLDEELEGGSWVVVDGHPNFLFKMPHQNLWETAMEMKSTALGILAKMPEGSGLN